MPSRARIVLAILLVLVLLAGAGLIFISRLVPTTTFYDATKNVCSFQYEIELNPLQTRSNNCAVLQSDWLMLSVRSNGNLSFTISLAKVGGGQVTLYNNTSSNLNASFPLTYSGAIIATVRNSLPTVAQANGSMTVNSISIANATILTVDHPYRFVGEVLVALGALGLFLVVWNPKIPSLIENIPRRSESAYPPAQT
ncbi:MAG: hypothetical protein ACHQ1H_08190 [Nitrososphaerales archaeon]